MTLPSRVQKQTGRKMGHVPLPDGSVLKTLIVAVICTVGIAGCSAGEDYADLDFLSMDTLVSVTVYGKDAENQVKAVKQQVSDLESLMSKTNPDSEISRLNHQRTLSKAEMDDSVWELIGDALSLSRQTGGSFDPALGKLAALWDIGGGGQVPEEDILQGALEQSGMSFLEMTDDTVTLHGEAILDLGGIAKGRITDLAGQALAEAGNPAVLSMGGDVLTVGMKPGDDKWIVGVRSPEEPAEILGTISFYGGKAVVTSGDYERYFEQDGKRYHHILDPSTGCPAESRLQSVTVLHDNCTAADAYSTALFVMGDTEGPAFAHKAGITALFVLEGGGIVVTGEMEFELNPESGYQLLPGEES